MRFAPAFLLGLALPAVVLVGRSSAAFPGDNGKVAFSSARDGNHEIYTVEPDGGRTARLTADPAPDIDPAWSADGTRIAFTRTRDDNDDIWAMGADGTGQVRLTTSAGSDVNPAWSPGGRTLVFASNRDGDAEVWIMNEDGSSQTQLTRNDGPADVTPAWSPDGSRIAFTSTRDGNAEIYVMNASGGDQVRLTTSPGNETSPNWSPDGRRIAFASDRDGTYEIYVVEADGGNETRLTRNLEPDLDPVWSPDGARIAFTSLRDGNYEIYAMKEDGGSPQRLTAAAAQDTTPDWQPVPVTPPPPTAVTGARLEPRWRESTYLGRLLVEGRVPGPARLRLVLRDGARARFTTTAPIPAGAFRRAFRLPPTLLPGRYVLDVKAPGSPTLLTPQLVSVVLRPPAEGVVARAWASDTVGGPPLERFPSTTTRVFAHFRVAALPQPGRRLSTTWYGPAFTGRPDPKPRSSLVISFVNSRNQVPLPRGSWRCVLRAGTTVVDQVRIRIG